MNDLPHGWIRTPLSEVCEIVSGGTPNTAVKDYWGGDIRWITPDDLSKDRSQVVAVGSRSLTKAGYESCSARLMPAGSVIFSSRAPIGYVTIAGAQLCTNQGCKSAVPSEVIDSKYLYWHLVHMTPEIESRASGTTFKEISAKRFGETILVLPPLAEQYRIVAAIESHFSRLESALNSIKRAAELNVKMISGALVGVTAYHDRRATWEELVIGRMARVSTGATPLKSRADYYRDGTIPWVTSTLLNKPFIDATNTMITPRALEETSVKLFPPGTLLLAMYGEGRTRGRVAELRISATTNQACAAIQLLPEYEDYRSWVKLVLEASYEQTRRLASGGVQPNLSLGIVRGIQIPLPPPDVRDGIIAEIESMREVSDRFAYAVRFLAARGRQLRVQILQRAFDGVLIPADPV